MKQMSEVFKDSGGKLYQELGDLEAVKASNKALVGE